MKIKNRLRPGSGPESPQNPLVPKENHRPDPPPDPPRGMGDKNKIKSVLKYNWDEAPSENRNRTTTPNFRRL